MKAFICVSALLLAAIPVLAQAQTADTLDKIRQSGTIALGHRESSIPFSYDAGTGKPVGFAVDLCMKVVDAIKDQLKLPALKVTYTPVTSANRIPLVQNGTIDLECGSTTNSMARQQQVAFSPNYFVTNVSAAVKKSSGIGSLADLNGKTIVTTTGTTSIPLLRAYKRTENVQVNEIYGKDHSDSFLSLATDRAVAFVMDDILLAGAIASSPNPQDYKILPDVLRQEPYGVMFRKDDPKFKAVVDQVFRDLMKSGQINAMYDQWFMKPIPPRGVNLNFPMSDAVKEIYRNPTDKGI
jgi:glutamate/aspartate transport system substrate-binding protein